MKNKEKESTDETSQKSTPAAGNDATVKPEGSYNPLGGQVYEPPYARPADKFSQDDLHKDIAEPTYTPPPMEEATIPNKEQQESSSSQNKKPKEEPFNPDMNQMPPGEQEDAAAKMAVYLVNLYEQLKLQGRGLVKIGERKINKLAMAGDIDLSIIVPVGIDEQKTLGEFFKFYNEQCSHLFKTSQEFKDAIIPPLTRELAKRGHGISDAQLIIFLVAGDIFTCVQEAVKTRMVLSDMLKFAKEQTANSRQPNASAPPPPSSPAPSYQQQAQQQAEPVMQQQPVVEEPVALQDKILAKHIPYVNKGDGLPRYGGRRKLAGIKKVADMEKQTTKKQVSRKDKILNETREKVSPMVAMTSAMPVPDGKKKKAGRPPGSKNKKKS